jgi:hypothetical protein
LAQAQEGVEDHHGAVAEGGGGAVVTAVQAHTVDRHQGHEVG